MSPRRLSPKRARRTISAWAALVTFGGGTLGVAGWLLEAPELTRFVSSWPTMKPPTAVALLAAGLALFLASRERQVPRGRRRSGRQVAGLLLALGPLLIGLQTLGDYARQIREDGIHHILNGVSLLHPAPATALGLTLAGLALWIWRYPRFLLVLSVCAGGIMALAWLAFTGLLYGVTARAGAGFFGTVSLPTALSFFALGIGLFFLRPAHGVARLIGSSQPAGIMARRLAPLAVSLTLGLGTFRLWLETNWHISSELGATIYGTGMLGSLMILTWRGTWIFGRLDLRHRQAQEKIARELASREATLRRLEKSEAKLAASDHRFRGIFNSTFNFIGLLNLEGKLLEANQTALDLIGQPRAAVLGQHFADTPWWAHSPLEQARMHAAIQRATRGETVRFETNQPGLDGQMHIVDFTLTPVLDESLQVVQLVPEGRDITERKQAEAELASNEALLRQFIKHTPAAIAMLDTEMRYVRVSDRWLSDYHLDGREIIGRSHYEVFPDVPQHWREIHQRVLAGAVEGCDEDPFPRADGSQEWLQWEARPWLQSSGQIGGLVFYTQVITDRKMAEARLRESEERFRGAFENSSVGMAMVSVEGHWLRVNSALCKIVGRTEAELLACSFQDITHPDDLGLDLDHVRAMLAGDSDHYKMEKRYLHKDGHIVWILLAATLLRGAKREPLYFVSQIQDITERHQAAERTRVSLEEKEVLLREIHHRVKNNLQVISSLLQLQSGYLHDPRDAALFRDCQARVHAMGLVHDRLYRSGNLATIDFAEHLAELTTLIERGQGQAAGRIRIAVESDPMEVNLDLAIPLGLITAELITNAYKHAFTTPASGQIAVRLKCRSEGYYALTVEDNGVGLPPDFDPQKARSLGLRLIRALAGQLGAELSITSPVQGTLVQLFFPLARNAP